MPNRVALNRQGVIEQHYEGDQTDASLNYAVEETNKHILRLQAAKKAILILVDVSKLGHLTTATRKAAIKALMHVHYDKIAVFGTTTFTKALINLIAHAAGKSQAVKVFKTRVDAITWLRKHDK
jgi:predicted glycosyltransferase